MAENRKQYIEQLEDELHQLNTQLDSVEEFSEDLRFEQREAMRKQALKLKGLIEDVEKRVDEAKSVPDDVWPEAKSNLKFTQRALYNSINYFFAHFEKRKDN